MISKAEAIVHEHVAEFLKLQWRGVIFRTDFAAGIKMTPGMAARHKKLQQGRAYPDLFIAKPIFNEQQAKWFSGLYIELKADDVKVYRQNGNFTTPHIAEQSETLDELRKLGYCAEFCCGFEQARKLINWYLKGCHGHVQMLRGSDGSHKFKNLTTLEEY